MGARKERSGLRLLEQWQADIKETEATFQQKVQDTRRRQLTRKQRQRRILRHGGAGPEEQGPTAGHERDENEGSGEEQYTPAPKVSGLHPSSFVVLGTEASPPSPPLIGTMPASGRQGLGPLLMDGVRGQRQGSGLGPRHAPPRAEPFGSTSFDRGSHSPAGLPTQDPPLELSDLPDATADLGAGSGSEAGSALELHALGGDVGTGLGGFAVLLEQEEEGAEQQEEADGEGVQQEKEAAVPESGGDEEAALFAGEMASEQGCSEDEEEDDDEAFVTAFQSKATSAALTAYASANSLSPAGSTGTVGRRLRQAAARLSVRGRAHSTAGSGSGAEEEEEGEGDISMGPSASSPGAASDEVTSPEPQLPGPQLPAWELGQQAVVVTSAQAAERRVGGELGMQLAGCQTVAGEDPEHVLAGRGTQHAPAAAAGPSSCNSSVAEEAGAGGIAEQVASAAEEPRPAVAWGQVGADAGAAGVHFSPQRLAVAWGQAGAGAGAPGVHFSPPPPRPMLLPGLAGSPGLSPVHGQGLPSDRARAARASADAAAAEAQVLLSEAQRHLNSAFDLLGAESATITTTTTTLPTVSRPMLATEDSALSDTACSRDSHQGRAGSLQPAASEAAGGGPELSGEPSLPSSLDLGEEAGGGGEELAADEGAPADSPAGSGLLGRTGSEELMLPESLSECCTARQSLISGEVGLPRPQQHEEKEQQVPPAGRELAVLAELAVPQQERPEEEQLWQEQAAPGGLFHSGMQSSSDSVPLCGSVTLSAGKGQAAAEESAAVALNNSDSPGAAVGATAGASRAAMGTASPAAAAPVGMEAAVQQQASDLGGSIGCGSYGGLRQLQQPRGSAAELRQLEQAADEWVQAREASWQQQGMLGAQLPGIISQQSAEAELAAVEAEDELAAVEAEAELATAAATKLVVEVTAAKFGAGLVPELGLALAEAEAQRAPALEAEPPMTTLEAALQAGAAREGPEAVAVGISGAAPEGESDCGLSAAERLLASLSQSLGSTGSDAPLLLGQQQQQQQSDSASWHSASGSRVGQGEPEVAREAEGEGAPESAVLAAAATAAAAAAAETGPLQGGLIHQAGGSPAAGDAVDPRQGVTRHPTASQRCTGLAPGWAGDHIAAPLVLSAHTTALGIGGAAGNSGDGGGLRGSAALDGKHLHTSLLWQASVQQQRQDQPLAAAAAAPGRVSVFSVPRHSAAVVAAPAEFVHAVGSTETPAAHPRRSMEAPLPLHGRQLPIPASPFKPGNLVPAAPLLSPPPVVAPALAASPPSLHKLVYKEQALWGQQEQEQQHNLQQQQPWTLGAGWGKAACQQRVPAAAPPAVAQQGQQVRFQQLSEADNPGPELQRTVYRAVSVSPRVVPRSLLAESHQQLHQRQSRHGQQQEQLEVGRQSRQQQQEQLDAGWHSQQRSRQQPQTAHQCEEEEEEDGTEEGLLSEGSAEGPLSQASAAGPTPWHQQPRQQPHPQQLPRLQQLAAGPFGLGGLSQPGPGTQQQQQLRPPALHSGIGGIGPAPTAPHTHPTATARSSGEGELRRSQERRDAALVAAAAAEAELEARLLEAAQLTPLSAIRVLRESVARDPRWARQRQQVVDMLGRLEARVREARAQAMEEADVRQGLERQVLELEQRVQRLAGDAEAAETMKWDLLGAQRELEQLQRQNDELRQQQARAWAATERQQQQEEALAQQQTRARAVEREREEMRQQHREAAAQLARQQQLARMQVQEQGWQGPAPPRVSQVPEPQWNDSWESQVAPLQQRQRHPPGQAQAAQGHQPGLRQPTYLAPLPPVGSADVHQPRPPAGVRQEADALTDRQYQRQYHTYSNHDELHRQAMAQQQQQVAQQQQRVHARTWDARVPPTQQQAEEQQQRLLRLAGGSSLFQPLGAGVRHLDHQPGQQGGTRARHQRFGTIG